MSPIQKIQAERKRQIEVEGWTPEHDDAHSDGELLRAAAFYYSNAKRSPDDPPLTLRPDGAPLGWPWDASWWKPKDRERDLVRAGALCLAERERLRRIKGSYRGHVDQKLSLIVEALDRLPAPTEEVGGQR
jgi:hypothetical protein